MNWVPDAWRWREVDGRDVSSPQKVASVVEDKAVDGEDQGGAAFGRADCCGRQSGEMRLMSVSTVTTGTA